jgi:flagellar assembly protein FliH
MATATKFTFDLDFNAPEDSAQPEIVEEEVEVEEEEAAPTFSEEELAQARAEGYEAGKEDGRKESAEATEQRILETVESIGANLTNIYNDQAKANQDIAQEMIEISTVIAKKMFPDLNARNALGEVERVVQDTLKAITDEPRLQIMVHPDLREPLTDHLASMTQRAGFEGKVYVNPDTTINLGDCRVKWSHGAAVRDSETIMEMIDEIIERNLHGEDEKASDAPVEEEITDQNHDETDTQSTVEMAEVMPEEAPAPTSETIESIEEDTQPEIAEPVETTEQDDEATFTEDETAQAEGMDDAHFAPSDNIDDDVSAEMPIPESEQYQEVGADLSEAPVPYVDLGQDMGTDGGEDDGKTNDTDGQTVNSDPVSPDMTAAILDAQGAMSEEDEK